MITQEIYKDKTVNNAVATRGAFQLIHDNINVIALIECSTGTTTSTLHTIEEFDTEQEALDYVGKLGLSYELESELAPEYDPEEDIIWID